jgi:methyltransferase family protein
MICGVCRRSWDLATGFRSCERADCPMQYSPTNKHDIRPINGNQDEAELCQFLDLVVRLKVRSYLEIGSRNGDSFYAVMKAIGPGGRGLALDIPEGYAARKNLLQTMQHIRDAGSVAEVMFGSSRTPYVRQVVALAMPFDLLLIDADHRYEGVKADWDDYSGFAPVVAIHDIAAPDGWMSDGHLNEVPRFWNEIKVGRKYEEIINEGSKMGYGIIYR